MKNKLLSMLNHATLNTDTKPNNFLNIIGNNMSQHFIFNTLNSINSFIIDNDAKIATDYLSKFGKLLRLIIDNNNSGSVALAKELEALKLYVLMEQMRYKNIFEVTINVDQNIDQQNIIVPALVLQPYLELSIWQNLANTQKQQQILVDIKLHKKDFLQYSITETKSDIKPKIRQALLPHEIESKLENSKKWAESKTPQILLEILDLFDENQNPIAQKTIITLPLIIK
jgi:LytS/YehU family sensor histidine kinase